VPNEEGRAARSAAWGAAAVVFGAGAFAIWQAAIAPGSSFPILPAYGVGLIGAAALYMCFATVWRWWPAARSAAVASTDELPAADQAEDVGLVETTSPTGPDSGGAVVADPSPSLVQPPPSGSQPKPGTKRVLKLIGFVGNAFVHIQADKLVSVAEEFLSENADNLPGDVRSELEEAIADLKNALKGTDSEVILSATEKVGQVLKKTEIATPGQGG
jgi:hypothetical protein